MDKKEVIKLLELYSQGKMDQGEAAEKLSALGLEELGFATIDTDRTSGRAFLK
jgi:hypothetical protein